MKEVNTIIHMHGMKYIPVFSLDELDEFAPESKANAIDNYRSLYEESGHDIRKALSDSFEPTLSELGLPTTDIRWSLCNRQGDGVAFYGNINLDTLLEAKPELMEYLPKTMRFLEIYNKECTCPEESDNSLKISDILDISIFKSNHFYDHERSMGLEISLYEADIDHLINTLGVRIERNLTPDDDVNINEWSFTKVTDNKWAVENETTVWEVVIYEDGTIHFESPADIPDLVKKAFVEEVKVSSSIVNEYPGFYFSTCRIGHEIETLEKAIEAFLADLSIEMRKTGYQIIKDMTNDAAISELIEANEIMFDVAGDIIRT